MKKVLSFIIIFLGMIFGNMNCVYSDSNIEKFPIPTFPIEKKEGGRFVIEHVYKYTIQHYKQPLKIHYIDKNETQYGTPEDAFIAFVSSMKQVDIEWNLECWDAESRKDIIKRQQKKGYIQKKIKGWKSFFAIADFYLQKRVDRKKGMVILEYSAKIQDGREFGKPIAFKLEKGNWKATNSFSGDYVLNYLGEDRIIGNVD